MKFLILYFLLSSFFVFSQNKIKTGTIIKVSDGDTYTIKSDTSVFKVRLLGIDCPEKDQPFGLEAKEFALQFLNQKIEFVAFYLDRYGRTVADVYYNGVKINYLLVENGLAWHYTRYSKDSILAQNEQKARFEKKGLWSQDPIAPWVWRRNH